MKQSEANDMKTPGKLNQQDTKFLITISPKFSTVMNVDASHVSPM